MTGEQIRQARDLLTLPGSSIGDVARLLGVSRSAICKHLPGLADGYRPARLGPQTPFPGHRRTYLPGIRKLRPGPS